MITIGIAALVAVAALVYVLYPIFFRAPDARPLDLPPAAVPADAAPTNATIDEEIEAAVRAYREQQHNRCAACGAPVVARDARYCSNCGSRLPA